MLVKEADLCLEGRRFESSSQEELAVVSVRLTDCPDCSDTRWAADLRLNHPQRHMQGFDDGI